MADTHVMVDKGAVVKVPKKSRTICTKSSAKGSAFWYNVVDENTKHQNILSHKREKYAIKN